MTADLIFHIAVAYDGEALPDVFPPYPGVSYGVGLDGEPAFDEPRSSTEILADHVRDLLAGVLLADEAARRLELDVITVNVTRPTAIAPPTNQPGF